MSQAPKETPAFTAAEVQYAAISGQPLPAEGKKGEKKKEKSKDAKFKKQTKKQMTALQLELAKSQAKAEGIAEGQRLAHQNIPLAQLAHTPAAAPPPAPVIVNVPQQEAPAKKAEPEEDEELQGPGKLRKALPYVVGAAGVAVGAVGLGNVMGGIGTGATFLKDTVSDAYSTEIGKNVIQGGSILASGVVLGKVTGGKKKKKKAA